MMQKVDFYDLLGDILGYILVSKIIKKWVPKTRPNWTLEHEKVWVARFEKGTPKGSKMELESEKRRSKNETKNSTRIRENKYGFEEVKTMKTVEPS